MEFSSQLQPEKRESLLQQMLSCCKMENDGRKPNDFLQYVGRNYKNCDSFETLHVIRGSCLRATSGHSWSLCSRSWFFFPLIVSHWNVFILLESVEISCSVCPRYDSRRSQRQSALLRARRMYKRPSERASERAKGRTFRRTERQVLATTSYNNIRVRRRLFATNIHCDSDGTALGLDSKIHVNGSVSVSGEETRRQLCAMFENEQLLVETDGRSKFKRSERSFIFLRQHDI